MTRTISKDRTDIATVVVVGMDSDMMAHRVALSLTESTPTPWGSAGLSINVPESIWRLRWSENVKEIFRNPTMNAGPLNLCGFSWADGMVTPMSSNFDGWPSFCPGETFNERGFDDLMNGYGTYNPANDKSWTLACANDLAAFLVGDKPGGEPESRVLSGIIIPKRLLDHSTLMLDEIKAELVHGTQRRGTDITVYVLDDDGALLETRPLAD